MKPLPLPASLLGTLTALVAIGVSAPAAARPQSEDAFKYGSPPALPEGTTEERMWPAATAEEWKKPCLVPWQRTMDDAVAVSKATRAPILVCINMDGEIASEHYAGVRYRDPATAKLLERYVCVIGSVYRHTPRDHDEQGRRVLCPRFGWVTCGEHIAVETEAYGKYLDGKRISPRHIMLGFDGEERYDVYHSWDTATVFNAYVKGVEDLPQPTKIVYDGMTVPDLTASPDVANRQIVERAYAEGEHAERVAILRAIAEHRSVPHEEVLRLAVLGIDVECAKLARAALAGAESAGSIDVIAEALKLPMAPEEREALIAAAERLGEKHPRARTLAALHRGLSMESNRFGGEEPAIDTTKSAAEYAANVEKRAESAAQRPDDPAAKLEFAESLLVRSVDGSRDARWTRVWLEDARANVEKAAGLGLTGWRVEAALAAVLEPLGEREKAREHAVRAVDGGMWTSESDGGGPPEIVRVRVLALFAEARQLAIRRAYREKTKWPPEWLADVNTAYSRLSAREHPEEEHLVSYYDFLSWLGGSRRAREVLEEGLVKLPDSALLHDRLRARLLWDGGPEALESEYGRRLEAPGSSKQVRWYAGYASLVAAENFRRRNEPERALEAYARGIAHYERSIEDVPEGRDSCDHFVAMAHAGRARVLLETGDLAAATEAALAGLARRPDSTRTMDGLDITPGMTALMLKSRLEGAGRTELGQRLEKAMDAIDPALFQEPDFAREGESARGGRRNRR